MQLLRRFRRGTTALTVAAVILGCGKGDGAPATSKVPAHAGDVWQIQPDNSKPQSEAAILAYANGLHVIVLDGDEVFTGMTRLSTERGPAGGRSIKLANGLTAQLIPAGDSLELRFSSGESITMRKQNDRKS